MSRSTSNEITNNQLSSSTTNITSTSSNHDYESVINTTTKIQTIEHEIQINNLKNTKWDLQVSNP